MYPRIETILVPDFIAPHNIGRFVTDRASEIFMSVGKASVNPKSFSIKAVTERFYVVGFDTNEPYTIPSHEKDDYDKATILNAKLSPGSVVEFVKKGKK